MTEEIEIAPGIRVPATAVRVQYARSSGPGGQNVNKVNTKVELWLDLSALAGVLRPTAVARLRAIAGKRITREGQLQIVAQEHRTQEANRSAAMERLAELIGKARIEPKVRRVTKPSRAARARRVDAKKHRGAIKAQRRVGDE